MHTIYKREMSAYFTSAAGYIFVAAFYLFSGLFFYATIAYNSGNLSNVFNGMFNITLMLIPILTMRLLSDDKKQKTDQALLTAPISLTSIVMGKFFAALTVFSIAMSSTLLQGIVLSFFCKPEWMTIIGNIVGMFFLGCALIAVGLFISSLTDSQIVAAISTFAVSVIIMLIDSFATSIPFKFIVKLISWISFNSRYTPFTIGIFDFSNAIFFLSVAAIFVFLTIKAMDRKRWA